MIKSLIPKTSYMKLECNKHKVEDVEKEFLNHQNRDKSKIEYICFRNTYDTSDVEAIFYLIRNALAHGSIAVNESRMYKMKCENKGETRATMQLSEKTMLKLVEISKLELKDLRKIKNNKKTKR